MMNILEKKLRAKFSVNFQEYHWWSMNKHFFGWRSKCICIIDIGNSRRQEKALYIILRHVSNLLNDKWLIKSWYFYRIDKHKNATICSPMLTHYIHYTHTYIPTYKRTQCRYWPVLECDIVMGFYNPVPGHSCEYRNEPMHTKALLWSRKRIEATCSPAMSVGAERDWPPDRIIPRVS